MNINTFKKAVPFLFKAEVVPFIWGPAGVGKTTAMRQVAEELGYGLIVFHLGQMGDVGDLIGLPDIVYETDPEKLKAGDGKRKGYTTFMPPEWVPTEGKWIIFFDELNRARRDLLQAVFQLILERRTHSIVLPPETRLVAAGNPNTDEFTVTDITDGAFMDRFCHIKLTSETGEWLDFAKKTGYAPEVISFIQQNYASLGNDMPQFDLERKPSPRSWDAVSRLVQTEVDSDLLLDLATGLLGVAPATAFLEHIKNAEKPVKAEEVLNNFSVVKPTVTRFSDHLNPRQDLLKVTIDDLLKLLETQKSVSSAQVHNVVDFFMTIPLEMAFFASKTLFTIQDWMKHMVARKDFIAHLDGVKPMKAKLNQLEKERLAQEAEKSKLSSGEDSAI